jgi:hypothetical protein
MTQAAGEASSAAPPAGRSAAGRHRRAQLWVLLALGVAAGSCLADEDPCAAFTWNVAHERALFAGSPEAIVAGHDAASTPLLRSERLYQVQLAPQSQVAFVLAPGKKGSSPDGAYAGMGHFRLTQAGIYRVSADQPVWIDIVADGKMIDSADFQGRKGCSTPHKIIQYALPAERDLVLQLSAAPGAGVRVAITRVDSGAAEHGR